MGRPERSLRIPDDLLRRYLQGEMTVNGLAGLVGAAREVTSRALRGQGVDTSVSAAKRRRHQHRWESSQDIPPGTAYELAASLYRAGRSFQQVARAIGCNKRAAREILARVNEEARPVWNREVFRDGDGRQLDIGPFAARLRVVREGLGLSQQRLADLCGLSQTTIWHLEKALKGPNWVTLYLLVQGLGVGREELGVERDWPGPIPPGLLGPRRGRKGVLSQPRTTPTRPSEEARPAPAFRCILSAALAFCEPLGRSCGNLTYDVPPCEGKLARSSGSPGNVS
jgi:transcriptional regulator with XRE-family HTH domain